MPFRLCRLPVVFLILVFLASSVFWLPPVQAQEDQATLDLEAKRAKARSDAEFQKLKDAAEKLKQLSAELKEMIDQSTPHTLSIPIMKKTEEIEKVLKDIKSRTRP
jgi:type VI protein secretion system component VasF